MFNTAILFLLSCLGSTCTGLEVINVNEIRDRLPIPAVADDTLTFRCTMDMSFFQSSFDFRGFLSSSSSKRSLRYCGSNAFKIAPPVSGTTVDLTSLTNCSLALRLTVLGSKVVGRAADVQVDIVWTAQVNYTQVQSLAFVMPDGLAYVDLYYMRWPSVRIVRRGTGVGAALVYETAGSHVQLGCHLTHALEGYASSVQLSLRWSVVPDEQPPARSAINSLSTADADVPCRAEPLTNCSSQIALDLVGSQTVHVTCTYELTLISDDPRVSSVNAHASKTFSHTVPLLPDFALRLLVTPPRSLSPVTPTGAVTLGEHENVTVLCQLRSLSQQLAAPHVMACTRDSCFVLPSATATAIDPYDSSFVETRAQLNASATQHSLINVSCVTTQRSETATLNVVAIGNRPTRASILVGSASTFEASCAFRSEVQFEAHSVQFALADLHDRVTIAATRVSARSNASPHQTVSGTFSLRDLHEDAAWATIWERLVRASPAEPVLRLSCTIFHPSVLEGGERVALATSELSSVRFALRAPRLVQNGATRDGQFVARISSGSELASSWSCRWDCDGWCPPGATLRLCVGGETNVYCDESQPGRTLVTLNCQAGCAGRVDKLLQAEAALELRCTVSYDRLGESALRAIATVQLKAARRLPSNTMSNSIISSKSSLNGSVAAAIGGRPAVTEGDVHIVIVSVAVGCLVTMLIAAFIVYAVVVRRSTASRKRVVHVTRDRLADAESRRMIASETVGPLATMRYSCSLTESHPPHLLVARVDQRACCDAPESSLLCRCTCQSPATAVTHSPTRATLGSATHSPEVGPGEECLTRTPSPPPPDLLTLASIDSPWRRLEFCEWQRSNQPQRLTPSLPCRNEPTNATVLEQLNGPSNECLSVALPQTQLTASGILNELLARHEHGVMHYKPHADLV